jgi:AraC-like DNA-binding protein
MSTARLMIFARAGTVKLDGKYFEISSERLVFTNGSAVVTPEYGDIYTFDFKFGEFLEVYKEIQEFTEIYRRNSPFLLNPIKAVPVSVETIEVIRHIAIIDRRAMVRFAYMYCMGIDPEYFSRLLHSLCDGSRDVFQFIEENSMTAWPVNQYARVLGMSSRKLNYLFLDKYGVSAKDWLVERRLARARELLLLTSMKVTDIAKECGFNSHAHFSVSFRRRFDASPRLLRQGQEKREYVEE